jgi:hypothetical protein
MLALQRGAGNRAVGRMLAQRVEAEPDEAKAEPDEDRLAPITFRTADGEEHHVYVAGPPGEERVMIASLPQDLYQLLADHHANWAPYYEQKGLANDLKAAAEGCQRIMKFSYVRKNKRDSAYNQQVATEWTQLNQSLTRLAPHLMFGSYKWFVNWIKPDIRGYPNIFIGPRTGNQLLQSSLSWYLTHRSWQTLQAIRKQLSAQEWKDWAGAEAAEAWDRYWDSGGQAEIPQRWPAVARYHPYQQAMLPDGGDPIGVAPQHHVYTNTTFAVPKAAHGTPGGDKINKKLAPFGYRSSVEGMDGDHVQECQLGGPDELTNLWPLESSPNRASGMWLDRALAYDEDKHTVPFETLRHLASLVNEQITVTINIVVDAPSQRTRW